MIYICLNDVSSVVFDDIISAQYDTRQCKSKDETRKHILVGQVKFRHRAIRGPDDKNSMVGTTLAIWIENIFLFVTGRNNIT